MPSKSNSLDNFLQKHHVTKLIEGERENLLGQITIMLIETTFKMQKTTIGHAFIK